MKMKLVVIVTERIYLPIYSLVSYYLFFFAFLFSIKSNFFLLKKRNKDEKYLYTACYVNYLPH